EDHVEDRLLAELRQQELASEGDGEERPALVATHPARVFADDPGSEVPTEIDHHGAHGVQEAGVARFAPPAVAVDALREYPREGVRRGGVLSPQREPPEPGREILRHPLLPDG